ncbi:CW-type zinc finger-domain-containing protein, partial [Tribonema minus]
ERLWAQCDACRKWRQLPKHVSATQLPAKWYCKMNATDDTQHGSCDDPEEPFAEQRSPAVPQSEPLHLRRRVETREATLRTFCGSWARRLALEEHASARNSAQESGGRAGGMMWVQCSACSKWRYIWCNATTAAAERWFCVQNTYDESMASCSAPQE